MFLHSLAGVALLIINKTRKDSSRNNNKTRFASLGQMCAYVGKLFITVLSAFLRSAG